MQVFCRKSSSVWGIRCVPVLEGVGVVQAWANFDFRDGQAKADIDTTSIHQNSRERASKKEVRRDRYGFLRVVYVRQSRCSRG